MARSLTTACPKHLTLKTVLRFDKNLRELEDDYDYHPPGRVFQETCRSADARWKRSSDGANY